MPEQTFFVSGQGWSGWLTEGRQSDYPFALVYFPFEGDPNRRYKEFRFADDLDQFMDELDQMAMQSELLPETMSEADREELISGDLNNSLEDWLW